MKNLIFTAIAAVMLVAAPMFSDEASASSRSEWISGAMGAANPGTGSDGMQTSTGEPISPDMFLPPVTDEDRGMINQGEGTYGDDSALTGLANDAGQNLASQGDSTEAGMAFQIVNQPIGYETTIEHKVYQYEVLYEHDLASDLSTSLLGFAWVNHRSQVGTESGGGMGFFSTGIPGGNTRKVVAMFAAPVKFGYCDQAQVKVTGGTAWVPGCSAGGANCERIFNDPMSSSMFSRWGASDGSSWNWTNNDGSVIRKMTNSDGRMSVSGPALEFPRQVTRDHTSLGALKNLYGVRKIEASGICDVPYPSDDPYYVQSLPSCDDASLQHGDECGSVTRSSIDYQENPFSGVDMEAQLSEMMSDCVMTEETTSSQVEITRDTENFCGRSQGATFAGCALTHNISAEKYYQWEGDPAQKVERIRVNDSWDGSQRCKNLIDKVSQYNSVCTYNASADQTPNCRTIDGVKICQGTQAYNDLTPAPGGFGNKLSGTVTISDVDCDVNSGTVDYGGDTIELEAFDNCTEYEQNPKCNRQSSQCVNQTGTDIGNWCSEYEDMYKCTETIEGPSSLTKTKMVCGDQEFYCTDGSCLEEQDRLRQSGFGEAAAMLSAVQGIASHTECSDPQRMETCEVFAGKPQACRKGRGKFQDMWNCCDLSGGKDRLAEGEYIGAIVESGKEMLTIGPAAAAFFLVAGEVLQFLVPCSPEETELSTSKEIDATLYLGSYCGEKIRLGFAKVCVRKDRSYCAWPTPLGKVIMTQARPQLGGSFGSARNPNCKGLSIDELPMLDWNEIDLTEWAGKLMETGNLPKADFGDFDPSSMNPGQQPGGDW